jgi:hypothetical protein
MYLFRMHMLLVVIVIELSDYIMDVAQTSLASMAMHQTG